MGFNFQVHTEKQRSQRNHDRETGGKELMMVSIAEEKRRMMWSNILYWGSLVWLTCEYFFRWGSGVTIYTIGFAVTASVGAASALYSKLRIEMLTLLGKTGEETEPRKNILNRDGQDIQDNQ